MNLAGMLKDKRVLIGGAAVAALAGFVAFSRKGGGGGAADGGSGQYIQPASLDTTGQDTYNAIQAIGQAWQKDLEDFSGQLGTIEDMLGKIQQPTTPNPPPPVVKPPTPAPVVTKPTTPAPSPWKPAAPKPLYQDVARFTSRNAPWNSTLSGIAAHYKTSVSTLLKLNPSIKNKDLIHPGQKIRYK